MNAFDYVVVGAGSAGCVLANRLSADGHTVCLLEAGPRDTSPFILMPGGIIQMLRSQDCNWHFRTAPQTRLAGRSLLWPRGKTLGGSSAINAMCYIRGHAADYDHWAALGNEGWGWSDVLPLFRASENYEPGADDFHGQGGPLNVCAPRHTNPLSAVFLEAARQAGYPANPDFNGAQQEGVGYYKVTHKDGQRCSNARAFLRPAEARPNLTVITGAHATRVLVEGGRAVGVRYFQDSRYREVHATREVILSAGAIGSPHLLLLSGIGPREELMRHGIKPLVDLPGVGKNLQDHLGAPVCVQDRSRTAFSFHPLSFWRTLKALFQYAFGRRGELTSNVAEAGGFIRTAPSEALPDLQLHFLPVVYTHHGMDLWPAVRHYAYCLIVYDTRPASRGELRLASADPLAPPLIDPNHFDDPRDLAKLVAGMNQARAILGQDAFRPHAGAELMPGPAVRSDEQMAEWLRAHAETLYHPVGTCRMGRDPLAVVDARLRVHGIDGLRVADASIMPTLVGGNTNAPTTMIAEKAARMVLEDAGAADRPAAAAPLAA